jgi:hypothetical protein
MEPQSTVDKGQRWRIWHGLNYFIGGGTFLIGSILLFPVFNDYVDAAEISGWLYTIGSATFIVLAQAWKLWRGFSQQGKSWKEIYR